MVFPRTGTIVLYIYGILQGCLIHGLDFPLYDTLNMHIIYMTMYWLITVL